ncbi:MAG: helix-turn-helix domain-containing protein [Burkholderiales bacterium]|nr:helix-turn-helix domain-containing protein [Burkholderiales bacterium]
MEQRAALVEALKRALKARGITYSHVAEALQLSEPSVKRLFASGQFTLERFEQICAVAHTSISELARSVDGGKDEVSQLTPEQERAIMADRKLLLVALCALNHLSLEQIVNAYDISKTECISLLIKLDRIKLLELLPGNRIKLRVTRAFSWLPNGPIQQFFKARAQSEYFASSFSGASEVMLLTNGLLSKASTEALLSKLRRVANEFTEQHHAEAHLPLSERRPLSMVLAVRPWELDEMRALRRRQPDKTDSAVGSSKKSAPRARTITSQ